MEGTVYFIQAGDSGPVKIGWTKSKVRERLRQLQSGSVERLYLLKTTPGEKTEEERWHERFSADALGGEWFVMSPALSEAIETAPAGEAPSPRAKDEVIQFRIKPEEKELVKAEAARRGLDLSAYVRQRVLSEAGQTLAEAPDRQADRTPEQWLHDRAVELMKEGTPEEEAASIAVDELKRMKRFAVPAKVEEEKVRAEVAEAKLEDDPARDEFLSRRTLQLKGAGHTTQVAARMAREEWEAR